MENFIEEANTVTNLDDVNLAAAKTGDVLTYDALAGKWRNAKPGPGIAVIDNLESTSKTDALSANQGRALEQEKADKTTVSTLSSQVAAAREDINGLTTKTNELSDDVSGLSEDLTQTKADLKAMSTMTSNEALDYSINGNIVSADFVGYARKSRNRVSDFLVGYSIQSNGTITNASTDSGYAMAIASVESGKTYTIKTDEASFVGGYFTSKPKVASVTYNGQRLISSSKTITVPSGVSYVAFRTTSSYTTPQIEEGTTSTDYEPYGIIKPSGVVESYTINMYGGEPNTKYPFRKPLKTGDKIAISWENALSENSEIYLYDSIDSSARNDYFTLPYTSTSRVVTLEKDASAFSIFDKGKRKWYQVEIGEEVHPYEKGAGFYNITLPYTPLGVNDIKDELIVYADGTGKFVKRVDSVDLGSLTWTYYAKVFYASITDYIHTNTSINYICDTYTEKPQTSSSDAMYNNGDKTVALYYPSTLNRVYIRDDSVGTDANALKNALNGKNIYIVLATPQEITLTSAEVEQILALKTFADVTYIDADGMTYEIGYIINAGKAIKDLLKAINNASALNTVSMLSDNVTVSTPKKSIAKVEEVKEDLTEEITEDIPTEEV